MAYEGKVLRRAVQRFEEDRRQREERFQQRREGIFRREPRLGEIDRELRATMSRLISGALRFGTDPGPAVESLRKQNLGLQEERAVLLERMGLPADGAVQPHFLQPAPPQGKQAEEQRQRRASAAQHGEQKAQGAAHVSALSTAPRPRRAGPVPRR